MSMQFKKLVEYFGKIEATSLRNEKDGDTGGYLREATGGSR